MSKCDTGLIFGEALQCKG
uniref:Uncharacterized protein n=1 Tax=Anguilla anguilla TaxID=7936 RepID=A0A0E9R4W9_ANGAN